MQEMGYVYVGSLFSGAGVGDLGLHRAGLKHRWFCECDPFARRILSLRWPGVPVHHDVSALHGHHVDPVDVLAGGFPCQDVSVAGKGRGVARGTLSGLWFEFLRIIREIRPKYVVVENVKALLTKDMGTVLGGLAESGYDAEWDVFPAAAFGAPHLRERVVLVAYPSSIRLSVSRGLLALARDLVEYRDADESIDWCGVRLHGPRGPAALAAHSESLVCGVDDGGAHALDRLRCLGNGIVPHLMEVIGRLIIRQEELQTGTTG